jgi:hypothetical protein
MFFIKKKIIKFSSVLYRVTEIYEADPRVLF